MKTIDAELAEVREKIAHLQVEEAVLVRLKAKLSGESETLPTPRKRAASVKPIVLDIVRIAASDGLTTAEATALVKSKVPDVARDTVGSILSRLKSEGAFAYVGDRYYEKRFAPHSNEGWGGSVN